MDAEETVGENEKRGVGVPRWEGLDSEGWLPPHP